MNGQVGVACAPKQTGRAPPDAEKFVQIKEKFIPGSKFHEKRVFAHQLCTCYILCDFLFYFNLSILYAACSSETAAAVAILSFHLHVTHMSSNG